VRQVEPKVQQERAMRGGKGNKEGERKEELKEDCMMIDEDCMRIVGGLHED